MKSKYRLSFYLLPALALLISACSAVQPTSSVDTPVAVNTATPMAVKLPSNSNIDACALLTKADAESALGQPVSDAERPAQEGANDTMVTCRYKVQDNGSYASAMILVVTPLDGQADSAKTHFDADKKMSQTMLGPTVDIPGLGDSAYWVGSSVNQLTILSGNMRLILNISTETGDTAPPSMIDLGKVIIGRL